MTRTRRTKSKRADWLRLRLFLVAAGVLVGYLVLAARSLQLQVLDQEVLAAFASKQIDTALEFEPRRGDIYDRNGQELAVSIDMDSLAADPQAIEDPHRAARQLAPLIGMSKSAVLQKLRQPRSFVWLKRCLTPKQADAVRALGLSGIHFVSDRRRYYPDGEVVGQVLGFVGRDNHGLEGLEFSQENLLRGSADIQPGARDARGRIIYTDGLPQLAGGPQGHGLRLTLDKRIQYITAKELQDTVKSFEAASGVAIVMEPATGEVLALTCYPSFNPNNFGSYKPQAWRDRAVTDAFEPGSTFKVFLAAAALDEEVIQPGDLFYCEDGKYEVCNHTIHDVHKYGWLSFSDIIRVSSNIGAAKVGQKVGATRYYKYMRAFGFGEPTGIELPGETAGIVRPPEDWHPIDLVTGSFGQGVSVSAIQLAAALSAVANDGLLMRPFLVKEVVDARGQVIERREPQVVRRVISEATAKRLKRMLADVVTPEGTGAQAALDLYSVAGKTGTAQRSNHQVRGYSDDHFTSSFIGFVPVVDPRIVVVVVINDPKKGQYGGVVAAPAFRRIAQQTLYCLNVPPDKMEKSATLEACRPTARQGPAVQPAAYEPVEGAGDSGLMPNLTGLSLRAALDQLRDLPCSLEVRGSGRVVRQSPEPGRKLGGIKSCRLVLAPN
jgi:cell division protein FtsI (penicillin-binding protein 3)